eukprot:CAMPEP_0196209790 /NCGR_PEP_ID=MMETSP0912-20130531/9893_1 /TAXON_ID=49265 /ORGANISM="Thalassiosira rotula, Strain GSO102" /LENGTH=42 /DNA_ID= /DNA_START= /DNA_END= /DNA_ORIENTATION=
MKFATATSAIAAALLAVTSSEAFARPSFGISSRSSSSSSSSS